MFTFAFSAMRRIIRCAARWSRRFPTLFSSSGPVSLVPTATRTARMTGMGSGTSAGLLPLPMNFNVS